MYITKRFFHFLPQKVEQKLEADKKLAKNHLFKVLESELPLVGFQKACYHLVFENRQIPPSRKQREALFTL